MTSWPDWLKSSCSVVSCSSDPARPIAPLPRVLYCWFLVAWLTGCASSSYHGAEIGSASFLQRSETQEQGSLIVTAAVPASDETLAITGLDLYEQGIQPVWLEVKNNGEHPARLTLWSIDRDYFSPIEVAYMNRKKFSAQGYADMERWFYDNALQRHVPPGESRSGLVYTHLQPGTKGFNLDVFSNRHATSFTFFLPLPGFVADYSQVDFASLYPAGEYRELDQGSLETVLEELPCCATDETGEVNGAPFNLALVGRPLAVRRTLLRGKWLESSLEDEASRNARGLRFHGRPPDAIFHLDRDEGNERLQLHLWMAPWRVQGENVWLGQVFYRRQDRPLVTALRESGYLQDSQLVSRYIGESISADIDSAQRFFIQNVWYNHSLLKVGLVSGAGTFSQNKPAITFDGVAYFTEGQRAVLFLSENAVALDDAQIIYSGHKAAPGGSGDD